MEDLENSNRKLYGFVGELTDRNEALQKELDDLENPFGRFDVERSTINAPRRSLKTRWTMEATRDIVPDFGSNLDEEVKKVIEKSILDELSDQIKKPVSKSVLKDLKKHVNTIWEKRKGLYVPHK